MNINKTTKRTINGFGISLALLFGFMLLSGMDINAQTGRQERRQDRREDRQERREDRRDARQEGYDDGLREGAEDARGRRRANAQARMITEEPEAKIINARDRLIVTDLFKVTTKVIIEIVAVTVIAAETNK